MFSILLSMVGSSACAYDFAIENADGVKIYYKYINSDSELEVESGYYRGTVVIPEDVTYMNRTRKVTSIGKEAFTRSDDLNVIIPNSVKNIGKAAFYGTDITSITIPKSVTTIGEGAFSYCSKLNSVTVEKDNPTFDSRDNCNAIIETSTNKLIFGFNISNIPSSVDIIGKKAFIDCRLTNLVIPNNVTSIEESAFHGCRFSSLTIGSGILNIDKYAFSNSEISKLIVKDIAAWCGISFNDEASNPLTYADDLYSNDNIIISNLEIPDGVTKINSYAFNGSNITNVSLPNSITEIQKWAFRGCEKLTSISIPSNVINIGKYAFSHCYGLNSVNIGNSVTRIDDYAFYYCTGLTSVTIPNSVTSIGKYAFGSCYGLVSVSLQDGLRLIEENAFSGCLSLSSVHIPNSVITIGDGAFCGGVNLSTLTIGSGVKSIGKSAFGGDIITIVSLIENPLKIEGRSGYRTFSENTFINATLYVPVGTINNYKTQEGWKDFTYIVEGTPSGMEVYSCKPQNNAFIYSMNGQKINTNKRGLNIKKGKKYISK